MICFDRILLVGSFATLAFTSTALAEDFPPCDTFTLMGGRPKSPPSTPGRRATASVTNGSESGS